MSQRSPTLSLALLLIALLSSLIGGCGKGSGQSDGSADPRNPYQPNPSGGVGTLEANKNLAILQQRFSSAVISPTPWATYWWPYTTNGIEAAAAKYDAVRSSGAAAWERGHHGQGLGDVADWWGHCNGWAAAALLTPEPRSSTAVNGVTFGIGDRKALLSETFLEVTGDFLGTRVEDPNDFSSEAFKDVHPAQFYLMLTHLMGNQKRGVIIDRYTGYQVWNYPLVAYATEPIRANDYLGADPRFPDVHRVNVTTTIWWPNPNVDPDVLTPSFSPSNPDEIFESRTLKYELWLDAAPKFDGSGKLISSGDIILSKEAGRVVGGQWKNGSLPAANSHPDFMWVPTGYSQASGYKNPQLDDAWVVSNMSGR
ncbi:hypothetical protein K2X30_13370 [bacterium]|nr:hypothetical protein [bacterium]